MTKTKVLTIAVAVLLIMNVAVLSFLFLTKPKHPRTQEPKQMVIEMLNLDQQQIDAYEGLIELHRQSVVDLDKELFSKKDQLFALLKEEGNTSSETALLKEISALQSQIELTHLNHFRDIKALCNAEQLPKFNELTEEIQKLFKPKSRKNREDKKQD